MCKSSSFCGLSAVQNSLECSLLHTLLDLPTIYVHIHCFVSVNIEQVLMNTNWPNFYFFAWMNSMMHLFCLHFHIIIRYHFYQTATQFLSVARPKMNWVIGSTSVVIASPLTSDVVGQHNRRDYFWSIVHFKFGNEILQH